MERAETMRSMDSILADEPSVHTLPDGPQSDSAPADSEPKAETDKGATPEKAEAKASTKPTTEAVEADGEEDGDPDPSDYSVAGLRKALTAVRGDKRKTRKQWQEAERKVAQLEGQIAALQQMGARQPEPQRAEPAKPQHPDFYANPEEHLTARERAIREEMERREFASRANMSEAIVSEQHEDYDAAKAAFVKAAQQSPELWAKVQRDPMPARVVYREGKKLLGGDEIEQLRAELAALKANGSETAATPKPAKTIPHKSNASARGSGAGAKLTGRGPRTMNEILGKAH